MNRWLIFSLLVWPLAVTAAVERLEFVTPARVAAPGAISEKITVQTQTADGALEKLSGTADLSLTSSSPTGEFSSSATNWESVDKLTMASSTANRNFYYRDSTEGTHTLTITAAARSGAWSVTASQTITVGQAAAEPPPSPNPEPEPSLPPPVVEPSPPTTPPVQLESPTAVNFRPVAPTATSSLTSVAPPVAAAAPVPSTPLPAVDAYAAELVRLGGELARAAAKLQTAQKGGQRETKAAEPKIPKTAALESVATNALAHDNLAAAAVIEIPKPPSFLGRLAAIPLKIWTAIKNLFRRR